MTATPDAAVRNVAVVGRGHAAWLSAMALQRAFAAQKLAVTVIEAPGMEHPHAFHECPPELAAFHRLLGMADADLIQEADATYGFGRTFAGRPGESDFFHFFGEAGAPVHALPFVQFWARAYRGGMTTPLAHYSLAHLAAREGRLAAPGVIDVPLGFQVNAARYLALLRRRAAGMGIRRIADRVAHVRPGAEGIASLQLSTGDAFVADLYVDATGAEARLIGAVDPTGPFEPAQLPCDRLITASAPGAASPAPAPAPAATIRAHAAGWLGAFPATRSDSLLMAYRSDTLTDDAAAGSIARLAGRRASPDMFVVAVPDRIRRRPWVGNCVAVGAAAATGEPLHAADMHRVQIAITHLVSLLPVDRTDMIEADLYNEEVVLRYRRLRDFQAALYRLTLRSDEPFWDEAQRASGSSELDRKIELFAARGMIAQDSVETIEADAWQSLLAGHGLVPRSGDPHLKAFLDDDVAQVMRDGFDRIAATVQAMPPRGVVAAPVR